MNLSSPIDSEIRGAFVPISIHSGETASYNISYQEFERDAKASDEQLQALTEKVLEIFRKVERQVNEASWQGNSPDQILTIDRNFGRMQMAELARYGRRAYNRFFSKAAREELAANLQPFSSVAPTFISAVIPFPWEVLYEGEDYQKTNWDLFWGMRYATARILQPYKSLSKHTLVQRPPSQMLFCLHHALKHAKNQEWPKIRDLLIELPNAKFSLFSISMCAEANSLTNGEHFLKYLDRAGHNMLHFACHCRPGDAGADALLISLLKNHDCISENEASLCLETGNFEDVAGRFDREPLVFLNACQSGPSPDNLGKTYNLPQMFMERGAGAVIATACPVPDIFASEFARVFYTEFLTLKKEQCAEGGMKTPKTKMIGEALRDTRRYFIERYNNPLGLAYGLYSPAFYRLPTVAESKLCIGSVDEPDRDIETDLV